MLEPESGRAAPLELDGTRSPVPIEESATSMKVEWSADYRIEGEAFIVTDHTVGETRTITGYPTAEIVRLTQEHPAAMAAKSPEVEAARQRLQTGRNEPCLCGSGRKYKTCHRTQDDVLVQRAGFTRVESTGTLQKAPRQLSPDVEKRDALWETFEELAKPTTAQMDELLEGLLALPSEVTEWHEVMHALAGHEDLPGVYRRICDSVPEDDAMAYFHWAAVEEFSAHGLQTLLPEVALRVQQMSPENVQPSVLEHIQGVLLADGCEEETLRLAEHFHALTLSDERRASARLAQDDLIFELRTGMAVQGGQPVPLAVQDIAARLGRDLADDFRADYLEQCAQVICGLQPDPVWTRDDFEMRQDDWEGDYLRLYAILLRVTRDAAREDGVRAGRAFRALSQLLHAIIVERVNAQERRKRKKGQGDGKGKGKGKGKEKPPSPTNVLDYLAAGNRRAYRDKLPRLPRHASPERADAAGCP